MTEGMHFSFSGQEEAVFLTEFAMRQDVPMKDKSFSILTYFQEAYEKGTLVVATHWLVKE